jgi:hypothetical protein
MKITVIIIYKIYMIMYSLLSRIILNGLVLNITVHLRKERSETRDAPARIATKCRLLNCALRILGHKN